MGTDSKSPCVSTEPLALLLLQGSPAAKEIAAHIVCTLALQGESAWTQMARDGVLLALLRMLSSDESSENTAAAPGATALTPTAKELAARTLSELTATPWVGEKLFSEGGVEPLIQLLLTGGTRGGPSGIEPEPLRVRGTTRADTIRAQTARAEASTEEKTRAHSAQALGNLASGDLASSALVRTTMVARGCLPVLVRMLGGDSVGRLSAAAAVGSLSKSTASAETIASQVGFLPPRMQPGFLPGYTHG